MNIDALDIIAATLSASPSPRPARAIVPPDILAGLATAVKDGPLGLHERRYVGSIDSPMILPDTGPMLAALNEALAKHGLEVVQDEMMSSIRTFSVRRS